MVKIQNLSDIQQEIAFTEFNFYKVYEDTFKSSEFGRIRSLLQLRKMAVKLGLIETGKKAIKGNEAGTCRSFGSIYKRSRYCIYRCELL